MDEAALDKYQAQQSILNNQFSILKWAFPFLHILNFCLPGRHNQETWFFGPAIENNDGLIEFLCEGEYRVAGKGLHGCQFAVAGQISCGTTRKADGRYCPGSCISDIRGPRVT